MLVCENVIKGPYPTKQRTNRRTILKANWRRKGRCKIYESAGGVRGLGGSPEQFYCDERGAVQHTNKASAARVKSERNKHQIVKWQMNGKIWKSGWGMVTKRPTEGGRWSDRESNTRVEGGGWETHKKKSKPIVVNSKQMHQTQREEEEENCAQRWVSTCWLFDTYGETISGKQNQ